MSTSVFIAYKYLFLTILINAAMTFEVTSATAREPEDPLSFLDGFVEGDFAVRKTVVKRSVREDSVHTRVPQYMMDLYERLANRNLKLQFDNVRSIPSEDVKEIKELHSSWSKSSNFYKFTFNISHFPHSEYVLLSQIRIQAIQPLEEKRLDNMRLGIFSLLENPPSLLSSRDFNLNTESLYTVDITYVFQKALYSNENQLILVLTIPDDLKEFFILDPLSTEGPQLLVMSKTAGPQEVHEDSITPSMRRSLKEYNAMPKSENTSRNLVHSRNKRSKALWRSEELSRYIVEVPGPIRKEKLKMKKGPCQRKSLMVNFTAIDYQKIPSNIGIHWVIAPARYEAFQCSGRCTIPISAHSTMHALIQTLMHNVDPEQVPLPRTCCLPTKLGGVSLLYKDENDFTTYGTVEKMVVLKCGCF